MEEHVEKLQPHIGKAFGMLDHEFNSIGESYFLGKKIYAIRHMEGDKVAPKFKFKGVPKSKLSMSSSTKNTRL